MSPIHVDLPYLREGENGGENLPPGLVRRLEPGRNSIHKMRSQILMGAFSGRYMEPRTRRLCGGGGLVDVKAENDPETLKQKRQNQLEIS